MKTGEWTRSKEFSGYVRSIDDLSYCVVVRPFEFVFVAVLVVHCYPFLNHHGK